MAKPKVSWDVSTETAWDRIVHDHFDVAAVEEPDLTGVIYPKREQPRRGFDPYDLPNVPTRLLMNYLKQAQARGYATPIYQGREIPHADIKAELTRRPHVPSKREGAEMRRTRARCGPRRTRKAPKVD